MKHFIMEFLISTMLKDIFTGNLIIICAKIGKTKILHILFTNDACADPYLNPPGCTTQHISLNILKYTPYSLSIVLK